MLDTLCKSALSCALVFLSSLSLPLLAQEDEPCGIYNSTVRTFGLTPDQIESKSAASHQLEIETRAANMGGDQRAELLVIPVVFHIITLMVREY